VNDGKIHHVIAKADELIARYPNARVAALGLAFKANIDDFRESPARLVAATLARKYRERMSIVEPYATALPREFEGTGATQIDLDEALEECDILWCWWTTTPSVRSLWPSARARSSMTHAASGRISPRVGPSQ
jgi:UDP-N-acetyl-D-mannosaminuronic acid dehydrogenase